MYEGGIAMARAARYVGESNPGVRMERSETPSGQVSARMHPVTLRFAPELEREFQSEYHESTLSIVRLAMVLGILLYSIFGFLDTLIAPAQRYDLWFIRFAIVVPVLLGTLG